MKTSASPPSPELPPATSSSPPCSGASTSPPSTPTAAGSARTSSRQVGTTVITSAACTPTSTRTSSPSSARERPTRSISTADPPASAASSTKGSIFGQDKWTVGRRITLDVGIRYDHYHAINPSQTNPTPEFFASTFPNRTVSHQDVARWNNFSPRLGVTWDVRGNARTVAKASFGKFLFTQGTSLGESVNPNILGGYIYSWKDTNGDGYPQQNEWLTNAAGVAATPTGTLGAVATTIDPHLTRPYSYQVVAGVEQQIFSGIRVDATYYYRTNKNQIARYNQAIPDGSYTPVSYTNPLDGSAIQLYNLAKAYVGKFNYLTTNIAATNDNNYNAVELSGQKRFRAGWQFLTGLTIQSNKGVYISGVSDNFTDANLNINRANSNLDQQATYVFKGSGSYLEPRSKLNFALTYQHYTGYPIRPTNAFTGLNQGSVTVALNPSTLREPNVDVANLRLSRPTSLGERFKLEPTLDLYNFTNSNSVTSKVATYGANFLKPVDLINPRIFKLGLKLSF